jgi:hypothetical protein
MAMDEQIGSAYVQLETRGSVKPGLEAAKRDAEKMTEDIAKRMGEIARTHRDLSLEDIYNKAVGSSGASRTLTPAAIDRAGRSMLRERADRDEDHRLGIRRQTKAEMRGAADILGARSERDEDYRESIRRRQKTIEEEGMKLLERRDSRDEEYRGVIRKRDKETSEAAAFAQRKATDQAGKFAAGLAGANKFLGAFGLAALGVGTVYQLDRFARRAVHEGAGNAAPTLQFQFEQAQRDSSGATGRNTSGAMRAELERERNWADAKLSTWGEKIEKGLSNFWSDIKGIMPWNIAAKKMAEEARSQGKTSVGAGINPMLGQFMSSDDLYHEVARAALQTPIDKNQFVPPEVQKVFKDHAAALIKFADVMARDPMAALNSLPDKLTPLMR